VKPEKRYPFAYCACKIC